MLGVEASDVQRSHDNERKVAVRAKILLRKNQLRFICLRCESVRFMYAAPGAKIAISELQERG